MTEEHPGQPGVLVTFNVFLKAEPANGEIDVVMSVLRALGALAIEVETYDSSHDHFWDTMDRMRDSQRSGTVNIMPDPT